MNAPYNSTKHKKQVQQDLSKIQAFSAPEESILSVAKEIASLHNATLGYAFPSQSHIAKKTGLPVSDVKAAIEFLELAGVLTVEKILKTSQLEYDKVKKIGTHTVIRKAKKLSRRYETQYRFDLVVLKSYSGKSMLNDLEGESHA